MSLLIFKKIFVSVILFGLFHCYKSQNSYEFGSVENRAKFLFQFLDNQITSKTVVVYFCQTREYVIKFSKIMMQELYGLAFINSPEDLLKISNNGHVFVLDMNCINSQDFLRKGYSYNLFGALNTWIIFAHNKTNYLSGELHLEINSKIFEVSEYQDVLHVIAIFKYSQNDTKISSNDVAKWTTKTGFSYFNLPGTRMNLMGTPLKVPYYYSNVESLSYLTDYRYISKDNVIKFIYNLINILAEYLNATHLPSFTQNFGFEFDNKTQTYRNNSILGDVQRGIADIVGSYIWIGRNRLTKFDFIILGIRESTEFVFRAPTIPIIKNVFVLPFNNLAWYCILFCLFCGAALVSVIVIQEKRLYRLGNDTTIVDVFMTLLSALLQKSWILEFKSNSGKFALAVIYLTFMIIYTAYSASIIVFLRGTSESIKTFKDLYDSKMGIGVQNVSYNRYYFLTPNNGPTNEYWRNRVFEDQIVNRSNKNFFLSAEEGIKKVHNEYFAFQCQVSTATNLIERMFLPYEKCNIRFTPTIFSISDLYLAARKNSPYINHYRVGIAKILENGLVKRSHNRLYTKRPKCEGNSDNFSGIGLREIRFIFMFCCGAFIASLIFLVVEILISKFERKYRKRNTYVN